MSDKTAVVFGGGGARAAYQVGVLKAIVQFYPRSHGIPFKVLSGTSAGGINATALATYASCFHLGVRKLEWIWSNLSIDQVYSASISGVFGHLGKMAFKGMKSKGPNLHPASLFNNDPLRHLLDKLVDFERIDRNINRNSLNAISLDTSCFDTSFCETFYQAKASIQDWQRSRRCGKRTKLRTDHLLASAAIPLIFPMVKIEQAYYGDGSLHQFAPLSSPIHLGANRIIAINLESPHKNERQSNTNYPQVETIAGHLLDTIFSDTINSDLERLLRINKTLTNIPKAYRSSIPLQHIDAMVIKPSEDLSEIAAQYFHTIPIAFKILMKLMGITGQSDSSIVSYLLFDKDYCKALIQLGYEDTMCQIDEVKHFLNIR
ncbi:patatin-like phospholipase family protein [uncultured Shewanella sp.]|uniref:patatin-like phospholipase family protein n=1 Tax=uncultured Shewanella sp. TaxID=173975 RepID=UPI0026273A93|nr:patatin-like phospholipase family protein [uncultured Shewanella sp.]